MLTNRYKLTALAITAVAALMGEVIAGQPRVKREGIEWCNVWITHGTENALPRVLLIGDSITQAYYDQVQTKLAGQAYVGRLTTSKSVGDPALLDEVKSVLKQYKFDIVHFNNGMHGWDYTEAEYAQAFPKLLTTIRKGAPKAKLIWASTTPVREGKELNLSPRTRRVQARNEIALSIVKKKGIPVNDLFALVIDHPEYSSPDGVHASASGISAQARQVAEKLQAELKELGR